MWTVCAILGNAIYLWIVSNTANETQKNALKIWKETQKFKSHKSSDKSTFVSSNDSINSNRW